MYYKSIGLLISLFVLHSGCTKNQETGTQIILKNPSDISLKDKPVSIDKSALRGAAAQKFPLLLLASNDTIPVQLIDTNGDKEWDELFFLADIGPRQSNHYDLSWMDEALDYTERTYVRFGVRASEKEQVKPALQDTFFPDMLPGVMGYQPYQTDGPSWENDKVGFRHYLDGRNSKDVFGKKTESMSPRNVGINEQGVTEDLYHVMEDWGRDILSVGTSVGLGGYSLKVGEELVRLGVTQRDSLNNVEETTFKVLESGPLLSIMEYNYKNWQPEGTGRTYQVTEKAKIWPGMYGYQSSLTFGQLEGDEKAVIGLVNIHTEDEVEEMRLGEWLVLFTHDKQTYDKEWYLGLALILPADQYLHTEMAPDTGQLTDSFLAVMETSNKMPISYYSIACWELADQGFRDRNYFIQYLKDLTDQLSTKPQIEIINKPK